MKASLCPDLSQHHDSILENIKEDAMNIDQFGKGLQTLRPAEFF